MRLRHDCANLVFFIQIPDKRKDFLVFLPYQSFQLLELEGFVPDFYGSAW